MKTVLPLILAISFLACDNGGPLEPQTPEWTETTNYYLSITSIDFPSVTKVDVFLNPTIPQTKAVRIDVGQQTFSTDNLVLINPARDVKYLLCSFMLDSPPTEPIKVFVRFKD